MTRAEHVTLGLVVAASLLAACESQVEFRIVDAVDQDPFAGATDVTLSVRAQDGTTLRSWRFDPLDPRGTLDPLPVGDDMVLVVETRAGGRTLARGRSFPFDLRRRGTLPHPDVFLGRIGRFSTPLTETPATARPLAIAATEYGAIWIDEIGDVYRFDLHDRSGVAVVRGEPALSLVASYPSLSDAAFTALPDGALFGIGGAEGRAVVVGADGEVVATLDATTPTLIGHRYGAALAVVGDSVVVAGGAPDVAGTPTGAVTRFDRLVDSTGTTLLATALEPLALPRRDAVAAAISVRGRSDCPCARVAVVGGRDGVGALTFVSLVDPAGADATIDANLAAVRVGVSVVAIEDGVLALAGGRDGVGAPVDAIDLLLLRTDAITPISPSPPPLFFPRAGASSVVLAPGLAILIGGVTTLDAPSNAAELIEFAGNTLPTGSLVAPSANPASVKLLDRTILTVDAGVVTLYVSPRDL